MVLLVAFEADLVVEVRAARCHHERLQLRSVQAENADDIVADAVRRCRGAANHWHVRKFSLEKVELLETRPEVMAPFRNAVSFIDRDPREFPLLVDDTEVFSEVVQLAILWRYIEQTRMRVAAFQIFQDSSLDGVWRRAIDGRHVDACSA